ncbi:hypothetical protein [Parapedobacter indicus]|uniref:Uncharacterized protein n=1 Tax=Parapedobacter indicus TaxID=1477437 RepID=A0A1I3E0H0_9SPHI|nr:hypothetical protein [Parapedobacter indicus]PPL04914.1 hypothetical protein CLV26_101724 [Parapedobacter indicus]SFH92338.1 hypothetical protein SAMN05444682_101710 [Parapedobacter indicus]
MSITESSLKKAGFKGSGGVYSKGAVQVFRDHRGWFLGHEHPLDMAVHSMATLLLLESAINSARTESRGETSFNYGVKSA